MNAPIITDWLMVGITAIYVVATIFIWKANVKSANATRDQIAESKRQFDEENRAFVSVNFEIIRSGLAALHIHNIGKKVANNVRVLVNEDFVKNMEDGFDREHIEKLCNSQFTLGIEQSWYLCFGSHLQLEQMANEILSIDITYSDSQGDYHEKTIIDLKQYYWAIMYESPTEDARKELKEIKENIRGINQTLKRLSNRHIEGKKNETIENSKPQ